MVTLDGFIAAPNGELDAFPVDDEMMEFANQFFGTSDAILFGRKDYEGFVSYWDALADGNPPPGASITERDIEFANIFKNTTRIVFSRTLDQVEGNAILIKDNLAAEVSKLKQQPGKDLVLICGPELLSSFIQLRLIDEYMIFVWPTILGSGIPLFKNIPAKLELKLLKTKVFHTGAVLLHYQTA